MGDRIGTAGNVGSYDTDERNSASPPATSPQRAVDPRVVDPLGTLNRPLSAPQPAPTDMYGKQVGERVYGISQRQTEEAFPDIGWAVRQMHRGKRVSRRGWNGKDMWLRLRQNASALSDDGFYRLPYVEMKTASGELIPWLCSQTDLLSADWFVV